MKIVRLQAENIKRLKAISISPDGNPVVVVGGRNGQGKSSTLDSIEMALAGGKSIPMKPIRDGASKARVIIDTGEIVVTRTFTGKGTQLVVTNREGVPFGSPQTMLDRLVGELSFDPLEFARMKAADQAAALKRVVGLDLSKLGLEARQLYDERTLVNREAKSLDAQVDAMPIESAPASEASVSELSAEIERRLKVNADNATMRRGLESNQAQLKKVNAEVEELERKLDQARERAGMLAGAVIGQEKEVAMLIDADVESVRAQIATAEQTNQLVRANKRRAELVSKADQVHAKSDQITERLTAIESEKAEALSKAKFPVPGLAFSEDGITFNGNPFDQCCDSEKLKISVAMGLSLNPELKVILCRDGSLLDAESLAMMAEMAAAADAQVWLERVSDDGAGCSVVIEDGMIAAEKGGE